MSKYFTPDFLNFYKELAANNHKEWFDQNRERYLRSVKEPFEIFVNDLITAVQKKDKDIQVGPKDCIFRINRDVRFARDKTPYKIMSTAIVAPGGKKGKNNPGFYFELGPERINIYGGAYFPDSDELARIRTYMAKNLKAFETLVSDKKFVKTFGEMQGEVSSRVPAALKAAAEKQPLIYNKQFYFGTGLRPSLVTGTGLMQTMLEHYDTALPMNRFLRRALS